MKTQDRVRAGMLFDTYGALLTLHQQDIWQLYFLEDWSLAEISVARGVSRSAVHDLLERTENILEDYETRLGLLRVQSERQHRLSVMLHQLRQMKSPLPPEAMALIEEWAEEEGLSDV